MLSLTPLYAWPARILPRAAKLGAGVTKLLIIYAALSTAVGLRLIKALPFCPPF